MVDLTSQEEPCAAATLHIGVTKDGRLAGYTKDGAGGLDPSLMQVGWAVATRPWMYQPVIPGQGGLLRSVYCKSLVQL